LLAVSRSPKTSVNGIAQSADPYQSVTFWQTAVGFINQFAGPIALGNIGYKYTYIFVGWDCVETAAWYFFGVESQGRTLEQLEWVYNQKNPVKASLKADKVAVAADGHIIEEL
jgi:hypothetical protein